MFSHVLNQITSNEIKVCLLRDNPQALTNTSELDLLIEPKQITKTLKLLTSLGWVVYKNNQSLSHKYVAVKFVNCISYCLDIHSSLIQDNVIYLDSHCFFLQCDEISHNLFQPKPAAFIYHLICHVVLGKKQLPPKYIAQLSSANLNNEQQTVLLNLAKHYKISEIINDIYPNLIATLSDPQQVKQLKYRMTKQLNTLTSGYYWRRLKSSYHRLITPILGTNRGLSIAFIGPDGAGKTTFITLLEQHLNNNGITTRHAYMGPWFRNKCVTTLALEKLGADPADEIYGLDQVKEPIARTIKKTKGLIRRYLYYINAPIEAHYRYFRYVYLQSLRGRVVLIDRYTHDLEVGYKNKEVKNNKWLRRLILKLSPTPDTIFLLYNEPNTVWERKKEYPLQDIIWSTGQYLNIADKYNIEKIKTDQASNILVEQFVERHWQSIYHKKADFRGQF